MLTNDFISAVKNLNYLRVRIMLKDSMLVDPTFLQFNEMVKHAEENMSELWMNEEDEEVSISPQPWNSQVMNQELVQLINSFTKKRVAYLKQIIEVLYADDIAKNKAKRKNVHSDNAKKSMDISKNPYATIRKSANGINYEISDVDSKGKKWSKKNVDSVRKYAQEIIDACNSI